MEVGNTSIDSDFSVIVDSGTSFTYLPDPVYTKFTESVRLANGLFEKHVKLLKICRLIFVPLYSSMHRYRRTDANLIIVYLLSFVIIQGYQFMMTTIGIFYNVYTYVSRSLVFASCSSRYSFQRPNISLIAKGGSKFPVSHPMLMFIEVKVIYLIVQQTCTLLTIVFHLSEAAKCIYMLPGSFQESWI